MRDNNIGVMYEHPIERNLEGIQSFRVIRMWRVVLKVKLATEAPVGLGHHVLYASMLDFST